MVAESGPTERLPLVARAPLQAPDAVHALASVVLQFSVEVPPAAMLAGLALKLSVGAGRDHRDGGGLARRASRSGACQRVARRGADWSGARCATGRHSAGSRLPRRSSSWHWVDDQVRVDAPPGATLLGVAVSATVGAGGSVTVTVTDCAALPPGPMQVSVNSVLAVSVRRSRPNLLVARAPLQPPLAVQVSASVDGPGQCGRGVVRHCGRRGRQRDARRRGRIDVDRDALARAAARTRAGQGVGARGGERAGGLRSRSVPRTPVQPFDAVQALAPVVDHVEPWPRRRRRSSPAWR